MGAMSPWHIAIVAVVVLLLFGTSRVADLGKGLGEGIKNFKKGIADDDNRDASNDSSTEKAK
ncbi:MAG TPA: twin-arginine translocase TatA/TatE family subunit [Polyangiaceae bacterium]|nr:twin-arginine translocase TatA/TatE family subunit [Polyangiaceae bacterium]